MYIEIDTSDNEVVLARKYSNDLKIKVLGTFKKGYESLFYLIQEWIGLNQVNMDLIENPTNFNKVNTHVRKNIESLLKENFGASEVIFE